MAKKKPKVITKKEFDSWSAEKQQRALANKRVRQRIETKALPKEYQDRRKRSQWLKTEITPGSGTTYGDVEKQRKYMETLAFSEGDNELAKRYTNQADLERASNDWFQEYQKRVADANTAASQAAQATVQGGQNMISGITNQSNIDRDLVARQLRDRAAQLGQASVAPEFEQTANAARDVRAQQMATANQAMNVGANAASQQAATRVTAAGLADLANRASNQRRRDALTADTNTYVDKRAAWREKFINDAISEARKQVLEDRATGLKEAEFKLKAQESATDQQIAKAKLLIEKRKLNQAAAELGLSRRELDAKIRAGYFNKAPKSDKRTTSENRTIKSAIGKALAQIDWYSSQKNPQTNKPYTTTEMRRAMTARGIDRDVVNTAMDLRYRKDRRIGPVNYKVWVRAGYKPGSWGWPITKSGR